MKRRIFFAHDQQEPTNPRVAALQASGLFKVTAFKSGAELLRVLHDDKPDIVLLDALLDGPNGFDVCRSLRTRVRRETLPVVICSRIYRARSFEEEALSVGAQAYLLWPSEPDEFVGELLRLLDEHAEANRAA